MTLSIRFEGDRAFFVDPSGAVVGGASYPGLGDDLVEAFNRAQRSFPMASEPDWDRFKVLAFANPDLRRIIREAGVADPQAAAWLPQGLARAEEGRFGDFAMAWRLVCAAVPVPSGLLDAFAESAVRCRLPEAFIRALRLEVS